MMAMMMMDDDDEDDDDNDNLIKASVLRRFEIKYLFLKNLISNQSH